MLAAVASDLRAWPASVLASTCFCNRTIRTNTNRAPRMHYVNLDMFCSPHEHNNHMLAATGRQSCWNATLCLLAGASFSNSCLVNVMADLESEPLVECRRHWKRCVRQTCCCMSWMLARRMYSSSALLSCRLAVPRFTSFL